MGHLSGPRLGTSGSALALGVLVLVLSALAPGVPGRAMTGRDVAARVVAARVAAAPVVVVAAGDIACRPGVAPTPTTCHQMATAALIGRIHPSAVLALGDLQYQAGTQPGFSHSYAPSWGRFKSITHPVPGNHEYGTPGAAGYFGYFGARATPLQPRCRASCIGYYSYTIGSWHVVALDTRCSESSGRCVGIAAEAAWLERDLAAHHAACTLAYMHNPLFSGGFGATAGIRPLWQVMHAHAVDLVLTGHAHNYQRFVPRTPYGIPSREGITEIIAGTGGAGVHTLAAAPHQAGRVNHLFGVVRLGLSPGRWTSQFDTPRGAVLDRAGGTCH